MLPGMLNRPVAELKTAVNVPAVSVLVVALTPLALRAVTAVAINVAVLIHMVTLPELADTTVPVPAVRALTPMPPTTDCDITAVATRVAVLKLVVVVAICAFTALATRVDVLNVPPVAVVQIVTVPLDALIFVPVPAIKELTPIPPTTDCDITDVATRVPVFNVHVWAVDPLNADPVSPVPAVSEATVE
jgi:hypothetical protein